ncbi:MAG TPA: hypothetical protein VJ728_12600 [Candidatus Binataceae bacterium]|nr:hypothetical protein [Candidatus Binataceae bacterium]
MNCFEARNQFVAFWQKSLEGESRTQLLLHLRGCAACDRAFRIFALTAPVLYSASEPEWKSEPVQPAKVSALRPYESSVRPAGPQLPVRKLNRILPAVAMAAAAAIALYFTAPPRMTFEDAIAAENQNIATVSYPAADSFFGQELMAQGSTVPDVGDD